MKNFRSLLFVALTFLTVSCTNPGSEAEIRVLFLGDTSFGENYILHKDENVLLDEGYSYSLENYRGILMDSDLVISNLETPVTDLDESPLDGIKDFIHWTSPEKAPEMFERHKMTVFSLGNNHAMDFGEEGLRQTFDALEDFSLFGAGFDKESASRAYETVLELGDEDLHIAVIGGMEFDSSYAEDYDFFTEDDKAGVYALNVSEVQVQVDELRAADPEVFIILYPHWGWNYQWSREGQVELAESFVQMDIDLIIGHGGHAIQEVENVNGKWVIYGIGNFMFNSPGRYEKLDFPPYSMISMLVMTEEGMKLRLYPIFTNNLVTNYQGRFVTKAEFQEVKELIGPPGIKSSKDEYGYFMELQI